MKIKVKEKDVVKHWGIWVVSQDEWMCSDPYVLLSFTCPRVANVQHDLILKSDAYKEEDLEVREIK